MRQLTAPVDGELLAAVLARDAIQPSQVLAWAPEIAEALSHIHGAGWVHGRVTLENIWIAGNRAVLAEAVHGAASHAKRDDFLQFGQVLRAMAAALSRAQSEPANRLAATLDRFVAQHLQAESCAADMRKIAMALRLLRFDTSPRNPPAPKSTDPQPKMQLLFRVVPPEPADAPKRRRVPFWRLYWTLVLPAVVVTAVGTALCYLLR